MTLARAVLLSSLFLPGAAFAEEGEVTWVDPTCGYFVVKLPEGNAAEAFGLFSLRVNPLPDVGDMLEGDLIESAELVITNNTKGIQHDAIHWANARSQDMLVRNTPVQYASKWKRRR
jgi:hypothetical protein